MTSKRRDLEGIKTYLWQPPFGEFEYVNSHGHLIPNFFKSLFVIDDKDTDLRWSVELEIFIQEAGTPSVTQIIIRGSTSEVVSFKDGRFHLERSEIDGKQKFTLGKSPFQPVQSWQIMEANILKNELIMASVGGVIQFFAGNPDGSVTLSLEKESLIRGKWELGSKGFPEGVTAKSLKKVLSKNLDRRAISPEEHRKTAEIVAKEIVEAQRMGRRATQSLRVAEAWDISVKGGEYRIRQARKYGALTKENTVAAAEAETNNPIMKRKG